MYAEKAQWFLFILFGVITIVSVNVWAAKRDIRLFKEMERLELIEEQMKITRERYTQEQYKQLPVIPFSN